MREMFHAVDGDPAREPGGRGLQPDDLTPRQLPGDSAVAPGLGASRATPRMPHPLLAPATDADARPIWLVTNETLGAILEELPPSARAFAAAAGFEAKPGRHCLLPDAEGGLLGVLFGLDGPDAKRADPFAVGKLPTLLPEGVYRFAAPPPDPALATLAWLLGAYRFERYRKPAEQARAPRAPGGRRPRRGVADRRGRRPRPRPRQHARERSRPRRHGGGRARPRRPGTGRRSRRIVGDELLARNFPLIHAVGRAAATPPRLIDLRWGDAGAPRVTIVGKGVAFDTGGLNLKPAVDMLLMKKDMGGAAAALALADMAMGARLPIRLRVLVPAVENAVSGASFRPGDVLPSRKGLTVEIGNTDAEGRLILADALALADEETPDLLVDFATLTGAARVALGPDLPPFYTEDDALAADLARLGDAVNDPVWRLPLWPPYAALLESKIADLNHISSGPFAGSITAALFLRRFATAAKAHVHFDIYAWNPEGQAGPARGRRGAGRAASFTPC